MTLSFQQIVDVTDGSKRSLTLRTPLAWRIVVAVVALIAAVLVLQIGAAGIAVAVVIILLAGGLAAFTNTLVVDSAARTIQIFSGTGPVRGVSTIPFDSITMVTISDGATINAHGTDAFGNPTHARPIYSLAVEVAGKKHARTLINGIPRDKLVGEAQWLAGVVGKEVFIPSALAPHAGQS